MKFIVRLHMRPHRRSRLIASFPLTQAGRDAAVALKARINARQPRLGGRFVAEWYVAD